MHVEMNRVEVGGREAEVRNCEGRGFSDGARSLSDDELLAGLHALATCEKQLGAEIVLHLIEVERRRLHISLGYSSLYAYGIAELGWSENVAHKRAKAARAALACPEIVDHLATGKLTLSSVFVLAPHLDNNTGPALVAEACGKSRREVERQMAGRFGEPRRGGDVRTHALAEGKTRLEITITERCEALLREAIDLDGHRQAEMAEILERALGDYVTKRKSERHGMAKRPQKAPRSCDADRVSTKAKREVYQRDGGRCSFVGKAGHRCDSTYQLEYDHKCPRAHGGGSDTGNLRLLCRVHNQFAAEEVIGKARVAAVKERAGLAADCRLALTTLGFSKSEAKTKMARLTIANGALLEEVVRDALQLA